MAFQLQAQGVRYHLTDLKLNPHETRAIDVRKLRDAQKPDLFGNKIPAKATDGSLFWVKMDRVPMIGRTLVFSSRKGISSNFDCGCTFHCPLGYRALAVAPSSATMAINGTQQFSSTEACGDCSGIIYYYDQTTTSTWSSNSSACTVGNSGLGSSGLATGVAPGSATITASYTDDVPHWSEALQECVDKYITRPASGTANVTPRIDSVSPSRGLIGATTSSVTIRGQGFSGGHINTPAAIQVSNITTATDTQITFDAVISSTATPGNNAGAISITTSGQTSNAKDFFVQVPTSLSIVSPGTGSEGHCQIAAGPGCGTTISFTYQVNDQATQPINAMMSYWDSFAPVSPDPLQIDQNGGFATTCTPQNTGPCNKFTLSSGQFNEAGLGACSTICLVNASCVTGGPSQVNQTWHIAGQPIVQQISLYCEKVLVNGIRP